MGSTCVSVVPKRQSVNISEVKVVTGQKKRVRFMLDNEIILSDAGEQASTTCEIIDIETDHNYQLDERCNQ